MTPKIMAKDLYNKMVSNVNDSVRINYNDIQLWENTFKKCTLIIVNEIISSVDNEHVSDIFNQYWQEVKQEIEQL